MLPHTRLHVPPFPPRTQKSAPSSRLHHARICFRSNPVQARERSQDLVVMKRVDVREPKGGVFGHAGIEGDGEARLGEVRKEPCERGAT